MSLPFDWHVIDPFPVDGLFSICWSPDLERAVFAAGVDVYYSDNGIDWTTGTSPSATHGIGFIIWNSALSAFYGIVYRPSLTAYWSAKSSDGITWSYDAEITPNELLLFTILACNGAGQMLAITTRGECFRSTGGSWTNASADLITIDTDINTYWNVAAFHDSLWVVLNFNSLGDIPIATSPDGISWTGRHGFEPTFIADWFAIASNGSFLVALSQNNAIIIKSDDGITWTDEGTIPGSFHDISNLIYSVNEGRFIASDYDVSADETRVMISVDGETWTQDSGAIPAVPDLSEVDNNYWVNIAEAPELERFFLIAAVDSLTPVVTSPAFNGNGNGNGDALAEITGEGGIELEGEADIVIGWSYIGSGGLEIGGAETQIVLSADVSGMYTLVPDQRFDRVYTRNINPDDTDDVAIPRPFGKTGYFGG